MNFHYSHYTGPTLKSTQKSGCSYNKVKYCTEIILNDTHSSFLQYRKQYLSIMASLWQWSTRTIIPRLRMLHNVPHCRWRVSTYLQCQQMCLLAPKIKSFISLTSSTFSDNSRTLNKPEIAWTLLQIYLPISMLLFRLIKQYLKSKMPR